MSSSDQPAADLSLWAGSWTLVPEETSIVFRTKAMWVLGVKGTARALEGRGAVAPDGQVTGALVVDASSFDTGNKKRDAHLRTADFFETDQYPTIDFSLTNARPREAGAVELTGDLTIHGQTRPIMLPAQVEAAGDSATVVAHTDLDRSDWGVTWAKMGARLGTHLEIKARFSRT